MPMMCRLFKVRCLPAGLLLFMAAAGWAQPAPRADAARIEARVTALMARMTLAEKLGQLTQYSGEWDATGPVTFKGNHADDIRQGLVGSMLNVLGSEHTRAYQQVAMQSRLKIPLLFGQDVIHGYKTNFPIPLAEAASWDLPAIERSARIAGTEAAAAGIHWTFAPMVDVARDPRWGRVMEGAGEDPWLGGQIAAARVKGFQGRQLGDLDAVMATAKHFAAYGAAIGGRDYNAVDISERTLHEVYLPPFKAAVDAGVATVMNAFNDINGVPATASVMLQRDILKRDWGFKGFVVSDWGSIAEMVAHGLVADKAGAAKAALLAGSDMDMESAAYRAHGADLVNSGQVKQALIDDAVRRVLRKKFELGLFEDPYRFSNPERERTVLNNPAHRQAAREMAAKSIVLLKNSPAVLPLKPEGKTIAFIGPMVKWAEENNGAWWIWLPGEDYSKLNVSQWDGLKNRLGPTTRLLYAQGADADSARTDGFDEALAIARQADVVIVSVGEGPKMAGEARSRSRIGLPGVQEQLLKALHATGKPMVVMVNAGRPLVLEWAAENVPTLLYTWWLGSEAGNAIADVLLGTHNPSARLPISFPRNEGQIPVYYSHLSTGRPAPTEPASGFVSHYLDVPNSPRFAFGHGLSYTQFGYGRLALDSARLAGAKGQVNLSIEVTNTGAVAGDEVVQLYLRQRVASVVQPVMALKNFQRVRLAPGDRQTVRFAIDRRMLGFVNARLKRVTEPGEIEVMVGASSSDIRQRASFTLVD